MSSTDLYKDCKGNSICMVEALKIAIDKGYEPSLEEIKMISKYLGQPTKKIEAFEGRYLDVFTRLIQKNCIIIEHGELCIYSWNPRAYIRYFPVSIDAVGTILFIDHNGKVKTLAYPSHRTHDIEGHRVKILDPEITPIIEITKRIDGYPITFYYNPIIKRWIPATRYLLHNMIYWRRRVEVVDIEEIINPYVRLADEIAERHGLYNELKGYDDWTYTFILKVPEPAILKPNIELYDASDAELILLNARKPDGELLTVKESSKLIKWTHVPIIELKLDNKEELRSFIDRCRFDLEYRSTMLRYRDDEVFRPYTLEVKSKIYPEAMKVKYSSDPKSLLILTSYGYGEHAVNLLIDYADIKNAGMELVKLYGELENKIKKIIDSDQIIKALKIFNLEHQLKGEVERARRKGNITRFLRKLVALLAGETIYEAKENISKLLKLLSEEQHQIG